MTILPPPPHDWPRLQAIEDAAGLVFIAAGLPNVVAMPPRSLDLLQRAANADGLWAAYEQEVAVGFALALTLADGSAHLEELSVDPAYGRRGIGTALVRHVEQTLSARSHRTLTLATFASIPWNAPWYRRLGYAVVPISDLTPPLRAIRRHEQTLGLHTADRVIMRKHLGG